MKDVPSIAAIIDGATLEFGSPITFVVGENGSGKSTVVEAIGEQFGLDPRGGRAGITGGNRDLPKSPLGELLTLDLTWAGQSMRRAPREDRQGFFFRAETVIEMNRRFTGVPGYWDADVEQQSHGEGFMHILETMLTRAGLYIFDEPETAFSFTSTLRFLAILTELAERGSQVICATHSPLLTATPGSTIIEMTDDGPTLVDWHDLSLVRHWRRFLAEPNSYLRHL
ncbi:AAA family ATPase [Gordonia sp. PKS22-38]|uniref:AAA family ATPase n=1 Tax=Gordonia prachuapensis TaxID=3115651 RepID=A0ABU7MQG2_9ACTN|nr:AAA family ATPase [Gordonia sp. PKS22-38]